jgi:hypothetical protein
MIIIFLLIGLLGCNYNKKQQVDTISIEELMGKTESLDTSLNEEVVDSNVVLESHIARLVTELQSNYDTLFSNEFHIFDRFGYHTGYKLKFIGKTNVPYGKSSMVTPIGNLFVYTFTDSTKLNNAFYNWLDCFGADCQEVKLMEDIKAIKMPPAFILLYDTTMVTLEYSCEHVQNDWKTFKDEIIKIYGKNYRYKIDVECGGPLKWKKF